ncbi:MAG: dTDP-4-dehydrorhamnose reductase [Bacteroidales bacterium]|jgi:dTDP-4-dehydrorhamnose reductase|nr:dTDP-4-dehydrorhamnose reductase [Bacteroidales bacterium]
MAVILITGANGQLGSELRNISKSYYGYDFIFTDIGELDITDKIKTADFIKKNNPDWIVNCAAYNAVDKAESEPGKAMSINSTAVRNISESIKGSDCRFIHISTDYVFSGNANIPYNEDAVPDPLTSYGRSKLEGEKAALLHNHSMVIRTSWLYSSYGANFVKTIMSKAKQNDSLSVVFDQTGTPTWAADLAAAVMNVISSVIRNQVAFTAGIYHYTNEGVCSWYDFAAAIVEEAGLTCKVNPILSAEYKSAAKRPFYSVLDKSKIKEYYNLEIPHWKESLKRCINQLI